MTYMDEVMTVEEFQRRWPNPTRWMRRLTEDLRPTERVRIEVAFLDGQKYAVSGEACR